MCRSVGEPLKGGEFLRESQPHAGDAGSHRLFPGMDLSEKAHPDPGRERIHAPGHGGNPVRHRAGHTLFQGVQEGVLIGIDVQEEVREGRRGLDIAAGHHVGDVEIPVVADGGHHRHRTGRNRDGEVVVVETREVHFRAAAAEDEDGVIRLLLRLQEGRDDRGRRLLTLHQGFVQVQPERVTRLILKQMAAEVAIPRRGLGRNHGQPVRKPREFQFLLHVHVSPGGKPFDGLLLLQGLGPDREGRVDFIDKQGDAVQFTEIHLYPHEDRDPRLERLAGLLLEKGLELRKMPFPDHGADVGHLPPPHRLAEVQVAVAVGPGTPGTDLPLHPILVRKGVRDPFLHHGQQF